MLNQFRLFGPRILWMESFYKKVVRENFMKDGTGQALFCFCKPGFPIMIQDWMRILQPFEKWKAGDPRKFFGTEVAFF